MPVVVADRNFSTIGYVAPTVFLKAGGTVPRWNYYATFEQAAAAFIDPAPVQPAGSVTFRPDGTPQTFGINVDFYVLISGKWVPVDYSYMKEKGVPDAVIRFYKTDGSGAYYAVFNNDYFAISATTVNNYPPEKIAALDSFYREVAILKYRYNSLVVFLNTLATRQLSAQEQQIFNQGLLRLQAMNNQIRDIQGIEITYTATGAIGIPVILVIATILILAAVTGWTVSSILTEREKTKRINDSYDLSRWIADKKTEIAAAVTSGSITQAQADSINKTLDSVALTADRVANESVKNESVFSTIGSAVKWVAAAGIVYFVSQILKKDTNG